MLQALLHFIGHRLHVGVEVEVKKGVGQEDDVGVHDEDLEVQPDARREDQPAHLPDVVLHVPPALVQHGVEARGLGPRHGLVYVCVCVYIYIYTYIVYIYIYVYTHVLHSM